MKKKKPVWLILFVLFLLLLVFGIAVLLIQGKKEKTANDSYIEMQNEVNKVVENVVPETETEIEENDALDGIEIPEKKLGLGAVTVITVLAIILVVAGVICVMRLIGKNKGYGSAIGTETTDIGTKDDSLEENQIVYKGKVYELNEDLVTVLVMGIDEETKCIYCSNK